MFTLTNWLAFGVIFVGIVIFSISVKSLRAKKARDILYIMASKTRLQ